jgi:hypothetical protein
MTGSDCTAMCAAGVTSQAKVALGAASEATSGVQSAASDALELLNQATSGALDRAAGALTELSGGLNEVASSLQVLRHPPASPIFMFIMSTH